MNKEYIAYHGTLLSKIDSISRTGTLMPSENDNDWLGPGAYYFIDGLNDPKHSAINWAVCVNWDKAKRQFKEDKVAVVKAAIKTPINRVFDLRDIAVVKQFHSIRSKFLEQETRDKVMTIPRPVERTYDSVLFDIIKKELNVSIFIGNFHIQLNIYERYFKLDSRVPNVSILCVSPTKNKDIKSEIIEIQTFDNPSF